MSEEDPLTHYGPPLVAVVLALLLSIMVAALTAGQMGGEYQTRALLYAGFVLWVVCGAAVVFAVAQRGEAGRFSAMRVLLWAVSIWLWPAILLRQRNR